MLVFPLFHCVPTNLTLIDVNNFIFVIQSQSSLLFWFFLYTIQFGYWYYEFIVTENVHDQDPREICNKDQWS